MSIYYCTKYCSLSVCCIFTGKFNKIEDRVQLLKDKLKRELNLGSLAGLIAFGFFLILYYLGLQPLGIFSLFGVSIPILMLIFGAQNIKNKIFGGRMSFGLVFQSSLTMCLIYASMFAMLVYVFGVLIPEDLMTDIYERSQEEFALLEKFANQTEQEGIDQVAVEEHLKLLKEKDLGTTVWEEFSTKLFGGLILSLIAAFIFKTKR
ncbi:MAG: DUF4199 domain-containing protein [Flavobacteriales bacterium]|nr:DUF4199 domain-containing protein [Flavobacteriales bacterium]